ncbi:hypothetical protein BFF99_00180 [Corynebacterium pseudotuberculosis]|nr:hypothetical protein BFF99_00180 [Corynebacterium pseudotuberculosis]
MNDMYSNASDMFKVFELKGQKNVSKIVTFRVSIADLKLLIIDYGFTSIPESLQRLRQSPKKRTAKRPQERPGTDARDAEHRRQQRDRGRCIKDR